jgi:hypothetical protein
VSGRALRIVRGESTKKQQKYKKSEVGESKYYFGASVDNLKNPDIECNQFPEMGI